MQVLIINSPLFKRNRSHSDEDFLPPLGLGYIATYLQSQNISVELIDPIANKISFKKLKSKIQEIKPEFLALNIFSTNYEIVKELILSIKIETHIIIGGLSTKSLYSKIIEWDTKNKIDVVIGDGELILADIVSNELKELPFKAISMRRVFKVDSKSTYFIKDISLMSLDRMFFKNEPLRNNSDIPEINLVTSRGCIYNCSFCGAARSLNKDYSVRERSSTSIIDELLEIKLKYPETGSIRILDDLFLKSNNSLIKAIDIFSKFNFQWRSMAHIKTFNNTSHSVLVRLKESGCTELFIGIESGSSQILKSINKTYDLALIINNFEKLFRAKINVKAYFIYGFPNEKPKDMELTYKLACKLKEMSTKYGTQFRTSVFQFRPYHGTIIYNALQKKYPEIDINKISHNNSLTALIGRNQFNFRSNNYSGASLKTIANYICKTNEV